MITVGNNKPNNLASEKAPSGLDGLVESLCESYEIPASIVPKMKSGLEDALYEFLTKFIADNNLRMNESAGATIAVDNILKDRDSAIDSILESARINGVVSVTHEGNLLLSLVNISESITYQLGEVDINQLDSNALVEAWKCSDISQVRPLLESIFNQLGEER